MAGGDGAGGAVVEYQPAGQPQVIGQPLLARGPAVALRHQLGADGLAIRQPGQHVGFAAAGDDGGGAAAGGPLGGEDLGQHAAGADAAAGAAGHGFQLRVAGAGFVDELGIRMLARIGGIQSLLVGEDHQCVGLDQVGHQRAEGVVVAKLDLAGHHGVVFVDDRHHVERQQGQQGGAGVEVAGAVGHVLVGQQHLGGFQVVGGEHALVGFAQAHLADGGGGLLFVHGRRFGAPAQALDAFGDGTGADQHHFLAPAHQVGDFGGPAFQGGMVEPGTVVGDKTRSDFDHDAVGGMDDRLHWDDSSKTNGGGTRPSPFQEDLPRIIAGGWQAREGPVVSFCRIPDRPGREPAACAAIRRCGRPAAGAGRRPARAGPAAVSGLPWPGGSR